MKLYYNIIMTAGISHPQKRIQRSILHELGDNHDRPAFGNHPF